MVGKGLFYGPREVRYLKRVGEVMHIGDVVSVESFGLVNEIVTKSDGSVKVVGICSGWSGEVEVIELVPARN